MIIAAIAFAYGVTAAAIAVVLGRSIRLADQQPQPERPLWAVPDTVDGLFDEVEQ